MRVRAARGGFPVFELFSPLFDMKAAIIYGKFPSDSIVIDKWLLKQDCISGKRSMNQYG